MRNPVNLQWLDLSNNYLENIEDDLVQLPQLKSLMLHGNYISDLEQVRKLGQIGTLQNLTLYGNFIEQIGGYRYYVLGLMYTYYETLRKLDSVVITNKEMDNIIVWNEHLHTKRSKNLKRLVPEKVKRPPEPKEDDHGGAST